MHVAKNTVVSLDVTLSDVWGNVLQQTGEPMLYLHGGYDNIVPVVEAALEGKQPGDAVEVRVEPEDGFGDYDEDLLRVEARNRFPAGIEVGMQFEGMPADDADAEPDDDTEGIIYTVTDIADDKVVLDGNHPLAGMALKFDCKVLEVRTASADEIAQGHPEDPDTSPVRLA
jgi:FKBP-type peptidyl-prolyl cis-trans isomerase SlyD